MNTILPHHRAEWCHFNLIKHLAGSFERPCPLYSKTSCFRLFNSGWNTSVVTVVKISMRHSIEEGGFECNVKRAFHVWMHGSRFYRVTVLATRSTLHQTGILLAILKFTRDSEFSCHWSQSAILLVYHLQPHVRRPLLILADTYPRGTIKLWLYSAKGRLFCQILIIWDQWLFWWEQVSDT